MKFRYNIFNFTIAVMFVLAFLCVMLSYATFFMFYPAIVFFEAGFVMLSIRFIKNYNDNKDSVEQKEDIIIMELASGENGEEYVMKQEKSNKKHKRRNGSFDKLLPVLFSIFASVLFVYLFVSTLIGHVK